MVHNYVCTIIYSAVLLSDIKIFSFFLVCITRNNALVKYFVMYLYITGFLIFPVGFQSQTCNRYCHIAFQKLYNSSHSQLHLRMSVFYLFSSTECFLIFFKLHRKFTFFSTLLTQVPCCVVLLNIAELGEISILPIHSLFVVFPCRPSVFLLSLKVI